LKVQVDLADGKVKSKILKNRYRWLKPLYLGLSGIICDKSTFLHLFPGVERAQHAAQMGGDPMPQWTVNQRRQFEPLVLRSDLEIAGYPLVN